MGLRDYCFSFCVISSRWILYLEGVVVVFGGFVISNSFQMIRERHGCFEESFPKDLERWFRACGFRCGFSMECFVWCSAMFLKCLSKWFSKDFLEKGNASVCKRFWKVFFGVFCLQRLRGCRIVLVDPGGLKLLQMLSTSPRLRS